MPKSDHASLLLRNPNLKSIKKIQSHSPDETIGAGMWLASKLKCGDVVALIGELGSGKTVFIQGVCQGLGVKVPVTSPTFTLIHEYEGKWPVYHFDFYRINSVEEMTELGCEEYFYGDGVSLIEWADKVLEVLPEKRFEVYLKNLFLKGLENYREIEIYRL